MTFAAPAFLAAAFAIAAGVVALHLLVLRPPPASVLPTARFVPVAPSLVRRRERRPQDRALLALRIATILLVGLAFAEPTLGVRRAPLVRIVAMDRSAPAARDSAARYLGASDILIAFDTLARAVAADSLRSLPGSRASSLSVALVAARRAAATLRADSIELIVISPFASSARDAATAAIRAAWPAAIRTVRVAAAPAPTGRAEMRWLPPTGPVDTVGAVIVDGTVTVAPFTRARVYRAPTGAVIARWLDGQPAAAEHDCVREIAIGMPDPPTRGVARLRAALMDRPCGAAPASPVMSDTALASFAGTGPSRASFRAGSTTRDRTLVLVLLVLAGAAALAELALRQ